jgi:phosphopantetheinyl transferase
MAAPFLRSLLASGLHKPPLRASFPPVAEDQAQQSRRAASVDHAASHVLHLRLILQHRTQCTPPSYHKDMPHWGRSN